jgi:hypothetical protein
MGLESNYTLPITSPKISRETKIPMTDLPQGMWGTLEVLRDERTDLHVGGVRLGKVK